MLRKTWRPILIHIIRKRTYAPMTVFESVVFVVASIAYAGFVLGYVVRIQAKLAAEKLRHSFG